MTDSTLKDVISNKRFIPADMRLVVVGMTGTGKSSTCNTITGLKFFKSLLSTNSCTKVCQHQTANRCGRIVQIVDTPGFFDTDSGNDVRKEIVNCVTLTSPGPHAILLVSRIGRYTEQDRNTVDEVKKLFGADMLKYLIVVFTGKDDLEAENMSITEYIAGGTASLKQLLADVNNRYITVNNRASEDEMNAFTESIMNMVDDVIRANGGGCYTTEIYRKAEQELRQKELEEQRKLEQQKLAVENSIREKYNKMLQEQDQQLADLRAAVGALEQQGKQANVEYSDKVKGLNVKLLLAQEKRQMMENERQTWNSSLQQQLNKSDEERANALANMQQQLDAALKQKEDEIKQFAAQIESERLANEQEIARRATERQQREEAERQRLAALEEERQWAIRQMQEQQQEQARRIAEQQRQLAEAQRPRHRHQDPCNIS